MWKRGENMATNRDEQMRRQALHIVFAALHREGRSDIWLAQQLGINKSRLWNYKSGKNRVPEWLVEQAARIVDERIERVYRIAPREILLQQQGEWRGRKPTPRKAAINAEPSEHNTSDSSAGPERAASGTARQSAQRRRAPRAPATNGGVA